MKLSWRCGPARSEQMPTGHLYLNLFESRPQQRAKNAIQKDGVFYWQRMRDSNPRERSQSPVCYRYTNPLYCLTPLGTCLLYSIRRKSQALFSFFRIFFVPGKKSLPGTVIFMRWAAAQ